MEKRKNTLKTVLGTVMAALGFSVSAVAQDNEVPEVERVIVDVNPPMHFVVNDSAVKDENKNQELWNLLMKYKLWGTDSIVFNKGDFRIDNEPVGYTGTSKGDVVFHNEKHTLSGPIISGDDIDFRGGGVDYDSLKGGPIYARNVYLPDWYNVEHSMYSGVMCFEGNIIFNDPSKDSKYDDYIKTINLFIRNAHKVGGKVYANWNQGLSNPNALDLDGSYEDCLKKETVPVPDRNLAVPVLNSGITWGSPIDLSSNVDHQTVYVHVPPITEDDVNNNHTWYDKFVQKIEFGGNNGKKLYILMPSSKQNCKASQKEDGSCLYKKTGRLTRIFSEQGIKIEGAANDTKIQVAYVGDDAEWNSESQSWKFDESKITVVHDTNYAGNLLFYTTADINWPSMNTNKETDLQGTYITTGNFTIADHISVAGQLIAGKTLWIESRFDGHFHYVPFNSPEVKADIFATDKFKENDKVWYDMNFYLTDTAHTEVSFDYCLAFFGIDVDTTGGKYDGYLSATKTFASPEDLDLADTQYPMPLCKDKKVGHVVIAKDTRNPTKATMARIKVKKDGEIEGDEFMLFKITNMNGATITGGRFDGGIVVKLVDSDNKPPKFVNPENVKLSVPENKTGAVAGKIETKDDEGDAYDIEVSGGYGSKFFEIGNDGIVKMKKGVKPFDYETLADSVKNNPKFNLDIEVVICDASYASSSFSYTICAEHTFTVAVSDVNEKPYFDYATDEPMELTIAENDVVSSDKAKYSDLDILNTDGLFTNNMVSAVGGDTAIFDVTATGYIKLKTGKVLDYETKNTYKLVLRVHDVDTENYPDLYDEKTFIIRVTDVDDAPKFDLDTYNGNVDENSVAKTVVDMDDVIYASSSQVGATITYSLKDPTQSFVIDPSTGVITVAKDAVLDYETKSVYTMKVYASDESGAEGQKVQYDSATVIIKLNDLNEKPIFVEPTKTLEFPENAKGYEIGTLVFDDLDSAKRFRNNRFSCEACEAMGFDLDPSTGELTTNRRFDYETEAKSYDLDIVIYDASGDKNLTTKGVVTVKLTNVNEPPYLKNIEFSVAENVALETAIKPNLEGADPDEVENKGAFTYFILDGGKEVDTFKDFKLDSKTGKITVAKALDFETTESYSFKVRVKDGSEGSSDTTITIKVIDVNEAPSVVVDTIYVKEDQKVNESFSTVKTDKDDPDTKNVDFRNNVYENTDKSEVFKVNPNGDVVLLKPIDYEADSLYSITVRVTDKDDSELTSTKKVVVKVVDVYEKSEVEITRAETKDSVYLYPDSIFTNSSTIDIEWTQDGKSKSSTDSLDKGCNVIVKSYKDPTKNAAGADTVVVCYSTAAPLVTVSANSDNAEAENIYTVVESTQSGDSAVYVNGTKNDVKVTVKDTAANVSKSFTVQLDLDTVSVSSKEFKNVTKVANTKVTRKKESSTEVTSIPENGDYVKNSYAETVDGVDVTVTYYTDSKGKEVKRSVVTSSGKTKEIAVIQVSYTTKIDGKEVTISYYADASSGERVSLNTGLHNSESVLSADGDEVSGAYEVSYNYVDKNGNTVEVKYFLDENGKIVKNADGDIAYNVGYTYVNKFGNSSKKDVLIVLDRKGPVVKIESPSNDAVLTSNFTVVKWTVDGVEQDTLKVQGLENGVQTIIRVFRDKAGNESRDSVHVMVKKAKSISIDVEKPVTLVDRDSVEKYYKSNPPKKNENYTVSFYNNAKNAETETIVGISGKSQEGSGEETYPGFDGGHLGPTLVVDARVPVVNALGGLATLDDIMSNGGLIAVEGVDAANSEKIPVSEYVEKYCTDEFKESLTGDYSRANLYWTTLKVKVWVYSNTGAFVDYYSFDYNLDDPDFVNDAGLLKFFFELKPDENGDVRTKSGRLYGTGAYLFKTEVKMSSKLRCTLPPISEDRAELKKNAVIKSSDELLKGFGYRRPANN